MSSQITFLSAEVTYKVFSVLYKWHPQGSLSVKDVRSIDRVIHEPGVRIRVVDMYTHSSLQERLLRLGFVQGSAVPGAGVRIRVVIIYTPARPSKRLLRLRFIHRIYIQVFSI